MQPLQQEHVPINSSKRYNEETVRRVLTRATELEQAEEELSSVDQIEALGQDIGIRPEAVRRALDEIVEADEEVSVAPSASSISDEPTRRELFFVLLSGVPFGILAGPLFYWYGGEGMLVSYDFSFPLLLSTILCLVLALTFSWNRRDERLGALSGASLTVFPSIGMVVGMNLAGDSMSNLGATYIPPLCGVIMIGTLLGAIAPIMRRASQQRRLG